MTATKATQDGNGKVITTEYVHKTNSASTLNQFSGAPKYLLGIEAFANGGEYATSKFIKSLIEPPR